MNTAVRRYRRVPLYTQKRMLFVAITVVSILLGIVIGNAIIGSSSSSATTEHTKELYYTSVEIEYGDTLWTIAEAHMSAEYDDIESYIREIKKINGIHNDTIHAGNYLMVPYYEVVE